MRDSALLILTARDVAELLAGQAADIVRRVRHAYERHAIGDTSVPHSVFLTFPGDTVNRIIGLPAYLGGDAPIAGMKWISSFPGNVERGIERASGVMILNSLQTGRPEVLLDASAISATRTAASAAVAMACLRQQRDDDAGLIGCGRIGFEIVRYLRAIEPSMTRLTIFDLDAARAKTFESQLARDLPDLRVTRVVSHDEVLRRTRTIVFATTATTPYVSSLRACPSGATILHISLRDIAPDAIVTADNVVDDVDHVCRARTSLHLAEQQTGGRAFIRSTLGDVLRGAAPPRVDADRPVVFSPFGLGMLDLAVADLVRRRAQALGRGQVIEGFCDSSWLTPAVAVDASAGR